jgi:ribosomal protein S18 acetylase RimI-like enzyme
MQAIQVFPTPDEITIQQVRALEEVCKAQDHLEGSLSLDPSLNASPEMPCLLTLTQDNVLIGVLSFFAPTADEAELVGLTHPDHRKKGAFRALVAQAARQAKVFEIPSLLFVCEPQSTTGVAALAALGAVFEHTEYRLHFDRTRLYERLPVPDGLTLHIATEADLDAMAIISAQSFQEEEAHALQFIKKAMISEQRTQYLARLNGEPVGIGCIGLEDGEATICGLGVLPRMQGRGIGRGILALMLQKLLAEGTDRILIEVDSTNANALHLYLSCGFVQESTFGYYRTLAEQFLA